jgi:hypothetical protein
MGKPGDAITGAELTTLTNRLLYEHKLAQNMAKQVPFARLFNAFNRLVEWLPSLSFGRNVVPMPQALATALREAPSEPENFDFDADFAAQFEDDAA